MSHSTSARNVGRAISTASEEHSAKRTAIQSLCTYWDQDPKGWLPPGHQPHSVQPHKWPLDFLDKMVELARLSGIGGRERALRLVGDSVDVRGSNQRFRSRFPNTDDIQNALDEYNGILARGLSEPGRTIQQAEQSTGNAVANAHRPPAAGNPDQIYYDFAVKRAYDNGGIRGSAFGRPEDGPTIMTPETAQGGIPANGNSVGPFITTTRLASKKIIYAKQNEDAMLLLEEHFGASMATILQDPQLQASEALKFPVDVTTKLWEIVNGCDITSLPAFHSMLHRAIKRTTVGGKTPSLGVAVVRQLQVDVMREMSDIREQREEARLEDRALVVALKASPTWLRRLGGASSTSPDMGARSGGDADPEDVDGPLPSSHANTRLGQAPKHATALARERMEKDAEASVGVGRASGIIIIPDDDGARTPEGSPTGIIDLTISPPTGGVAAVQDEKEVPEQDAAAAADTDVAMTDLNANDGDDGDVAMPDANANDRRDPAGDVGAHTANHGTRRRRRRQRHSPPSPGPSRPSQRRRLNPPVTEEQGGGGGGGTRWLELTPRATTTAAAPAPDQNAEHLRRERVIKRVAVRMLAAAETQKNQTQQQLAAAQARLATAQQDLASAQHEANTLRTANAALEERLEAAAVDAADAAERHGDAVRALTRRLRAAEDATGVALADAAEEMDRQWEETVKVYAAADRETIAEQRDAIAALTEANAELRETVADLRRGN
ncbi:hypothetical protein SLS58_006315 [Diplodia intermedia]|uniref:Uncharacterized protein n=1 Tax=Diplodia intermedia TaxID=856260 RepID=A0ABR3TN29_9PEZI